MPSRKNPKPAPASVSRRQALGAMGALLLPGVLARAQAPALDPARLAKLAEEPVDSTMTEAPWPPDLANLDAVTQAMARANSPKLSYLDPKWRSLEEWKQAARPVYRGHLGYSPAAAPLAAELVSREQRDGFSLEVIRIAATPEYHIPARVLVPDGAGGRRPAVVAMHCHSGKYTAGHEKIISSPGDVNTLADFRRQTYGRPWAEALARRGYIVIVIDAFYFGERRLRVEEMNPSRLYPETRAAFATSRAVARGSAEWHAAVDRVCGHYEHLTAKTLFAAGGSWPGVLVWDDMRTVDYLATRPDVDPERIGAVGLSIGGFRTAMLAAADARIKVASVTGWMTEFAQQLRNHLFHHTWMVYLPGLYRELDLPDVAGLAAPGPLLVQQCQRDLLYPMSGMRAAVEKLQRIYAKAGIPERFRGSFYDVPHSFLPDMQEEAFAWLDRWL